MSGSIGSAASGGGGGGGLLQQQPDADDGGGGDTDQNGMLNHCTPIGTELISGT